MFFWLGVGVCALTGWLVEGWWLNRDTRRKLLQHNDIQTDDIREFIRRDSYFRRDPASGLPIGVASPPGPVPVLRECGVHEYGGIV